MEKNWIVEYRSWGRYPEDDSSYSCTGPYTEKEAKELADIINKEEELKNLLYGTNRSLDEFFSVSAVELKRGRPVQWHQNRIRHIERKLKENKRRGSPDGSNFELPNNPKSGTFNLGEKFKLLLMRERGSRLPR